MTWMMLSATRALFFSVILLFATCAALQIEIVEPAQDHVLQDTLDVKFFTSLDPDGGDELHGLVFQAMMDGTAAPFPLTKPLDCQDGCKVQLSTEGLSDGQHTFTLLIGRQNEYDFDLFAETSLGFEKIAKTSEAEDLGARDPPTPPKRIKLISPKKNMSSFMDPNDVNIHFVVNDDRLGQSHHLLVELAGTILADNHRAPEFRVAIPRVSPRDYLLSVHLIQDPQSNAPGSRTEWTSNVVFYVWPDHSWARNHVARGEGLTIANAGEFATFTIEARDGHGNLEERGGASYYVRLRGPSLVMGQVLDHQNGSYSGKYFVAEPGEYSLEIVLHYIHGSGFQDFGEEESQDVIGWNIAGSPFTVNVIPSKKQMLYHVNPYMHTPLCSCKHCGLSGFDEFAGGRFSGRWIRKEVCESISTGCKLDGQPDDEYVWVPWHCKLMRYDRESVGACSNLNQSRVFMVGSSQMRTLFFDVGKLLGTTQVQPRKYWTDLAATDISPQLYFHWMVPEYNFEGNLDYELLVEKLSSWLEKFSYGPQDKVIVQASVHDIHLGSLAEYEANVKQLARFLKGLKGTVFFRTGDALHIPPGGRSIIERGLRDPRVQHVNAIAREVMRAHDIAFIDTHVSSHGRPEKCIDGYHYFDRETEELSAAGREICIGNSVARVQAQVVMSVACA
mmetsp:Transcript_48289/g.151441  ORF Transcript_48289/g.151441 Transcript_48289/m.151441 type:complete len:673 (-) Transcript_48289:516-2534(-)